MMTTWRSTYSGMLLAFWLAGTPLVFASVFSKLDWRAAAINQRNSTGPQTGDWKKWQNDPLEVEVSLTLTNLEADVGSPFFVSLHDLTLNGTGDGCSSPTNLPAGTVRLKPYKQYTLAVGATNLNTFKLFIETRRSDFIVMPRLITTAITRAGRRGGSLPNEFAPYVGGAFQGVIQETPGTCSSYATNWTFEIRKTMDSTFLVEDDDGEPDLTPGESRGLSLGPGSEGVADKNSWSWSVSLGHLQNGNRAGRLMLKDRGLSAATFKPELLYYSAKSHLVRDQVLLVWTNQTAFELRQLWTPQAFVNIVPGTNQYAIDFYPPTAVGIQTNNVGLYTNITGSPFVSWKILNPNGAGNYSKLQVIEQRGSLLRTNELAYDSGAPAWTLKAGSGNEQRVEVRAIALTGSPIDTRVETVSVTNSLGAVAYRNAEKYEDLGYAWLMTEQQEDPTGSALTTTFTYYSTAAASQDAGRLHYIVYPDGFWERREHWAPFGDPDTDFEARQMQHLWKPIMDSPSDPATASQDLSFISKYRYNAYGLWTTIHGEANYVGSPSSTLSHAETTIINSGVRVGGAVYSTRIAQEAYGPADGDDNGDYCTRITTFDATPAYLCDQLLFHGPDNEQPGFSAPHSLRDRPAQACAYDFGAYNPANRTFAVLTNALDFLATNGIPSMQTNILDFRKTTVFSYTVTYNESLGYVDDAPGERITTVDGHLIYLHGPSVNHYFANPNQTWKETLILRRGVPILREKYVCIGITNGTVDGSFTNREPVFELIEQSTYATDFLGHVTNITRIDPVASSSRVVHTADYKGGGSIETDLKLSETDEFGVQTLYAYDSLKRVSSTTKKGGTASGYPTQADIVTTHTYDARDRALSQTRAASGLTLTQTWAYDPAGRLTASTDEAGQVTTYAYSYPAGTGKVVTKTLPGGTTEILSYYLDRRLKSITGTARTNEFHTYSFSAATQIGSAPFLGDGTLFDKITYGSSAAQRWIMKGSEGPYRSTTLHKPGLTTETPVSWTSNLWYATSRMKGHDIPSLEFDASNVPGRQMEYNYFGQPWRTWTDVDLPADGLGLESMDRVTESVTYFRKIGSSWYQVTTNVIYRTANASNTTFLGAELTRLNGFNSTTKSELTQIDPDTNSTVMTVVVDRTNKKVTETVNPAHSSLNAVRVTVNQLLQTETTPSISSTVQRRYDALGRETQVINPLSFSIFRSYDSQGRVASTTDAAGQTTSYAYYPTNHASAGRLKSQTRSDGKTTYYDYTSRGEVWRIWGDVPYPEQRSYSSFGDLVELKTYRSGTAWNQATWPGSPPTADVTSWAYDEPSGLLTNKTDALGRSTLYFYTNNLLAIRAQARGIGSTNLYNHLGELIATDYFDATPDLAYSYNRAGEMATVTDGLGTDRSITHDHVGRILTDEDATDYRYDGLNGLSEIGFSGQKQVFKYDAYGRLNLASNGTFSATYTFAPSTDFIQSTVFKTNTTAALTTTRGYEYGTRVKWIENNAGGMNAAGFDYVYDRVGRRKQATLEDGSLWRYEYNDRDELISAKRHWSDWVAVSGQAFEYAYDAIGNRLSQKQGGDSAGQSLRWGTNDFNELNQMTFRKLPGGFDVIGAVPTTASNVTANSLSTYRRGEYFHKELFVNSTNTPVYQSVTVAATYSGSSTTTNGNVLLAATPETLTYDLDGNLKEDGIWTYSWDAENRLIGMTNKLSVVPNADRKLLVFTYDHIGRRRTKTVSTWNGTAFASPVTTQFLYDGWKLLAEKDGGGSLVRSYVWGRDLSGDRDSAGGVGGLLMVIEHSPTFAVHFPMYDGNGNVVGLVRSSGTVSARYETGPFAEPIRATGPMANANPIRFSSKFTDQETGLLYYGYRSYSPAMGRWVNRDPIEERDGNHLYAFTANAPVNLVDIDGRFAPAVVAAAYLVFELSMAALDFYDFIDTLMDPDATLEDMVFSGAGLAMGIGSPGSGSIQVNMAREAFTRVTGDALYQAKKKFKALKPSLWKKEAQQNPHKYTERQLENMKRGDAPVGSDGQPMEIHHKRELGAGGSNDFGNMQFMTQKDHRRGENFKKNHPNLYPSN